MSSGVAARLLLLNISWAAAQCTLENVYYERLLCPCPVLHFAESNKSMFCLHRKSLVVALSSAFLALAFPIHSKRNRSHPQGRPVFRWLLWVKSQASTTSPLSVLALFPSGIWHRLSTSTVVTCCHMLSHVVTCCHMLSHCHSWCFANLRSNSSWHQENRAVANDVWVQVHWPEKTETPRTLSADLNQKRLRCRAEGIEWQFDNVDPEQMMTVHVVQICGALTKHDHSNQSSTVHPITSPCCCQLNSQNLTLKNLAQCHSTFWKLPLGSELGLN